MSNLFHRIYRKLVPIKWTPVYPLNMSKDELLKLYLEEKVCPDCGVWDFYEGPSGGLSVNIHCGNCDSWFNDMGPFGIERIHHHSWCYEEDNLLVNYENYRKYNWDMPTDKWHSLKVFDKIAFDIEPLKWCGKNATGNWSVKSNILYFEKEEDRTLFQLRWL